MQSYFNVKKLIKNAQGLPDNNEEAPLAPVPQPIINQQPQIEQNNNPAQQPQQPQQVQQPQQANQIGQNNAKVAEKIGEQVWGQSGRESIIASIPGLTPAEQGQINIAAQNYIRMVGQQRLPKYIKNDKGKKINIKFEVYFIFSKVKEDKTGNLYYIIKGPQEITNIVLDKLKSFGYDVSGLSQQNNEQPDQQNPGNQLAQRDQPFQDETTVEVQHDQEFKLINIKFNYNKDVIDYLRNNSLLYEFRPPINPLTCLIFNRAKNVIVPAQFREIAVKLKEFKYNVDKFYQFINDFEKFCRSNKISLVHPNKILHVRFANNNMRNDFVSQKEQAIQSSIDKIESTLKQMDNSLQNLRTEYSSVSKDATIDPAEKARLLEEIKEKGLKLKDEKTKLEPRLKQKIQELKTEQSSFSKTYKANEEHPNNKFLIVVDISTQDTKYEKLESARKELRELINFSFPSDAHATDLIPAPVQNVLPGAEGNAAPANNNPQGMKWFIPEGDKKNAHTAYLHGTYDDFVKFGTLLKKNQWDISKLKSLIGVLLNNKILEKTRFTGQLDGYEQYTEDGTQLRDENGDPVWNYKKFYEDLDGMLNADPASNVKLYSKQKMGIAWLYERNSAILGDKTGTGKTLTTLVAAKIRTEPKNSPKAIEIKKEADATKDPAKKQGLLDKYEELQKNHAGRILIFTLKSIQSQWVREVINRLGTSPDQVSTDPLSKAKWIVLAYNDIQAKQKIANGQLAWVDNVPNGIPIIDSRRPGMQERINALFTPNQWEVVIFDEAHSLKNPNSAISKMLEMLAPKIPFKWAASATIAANTAKDVHNILKVIGHSLGGLSGAKFGAEFVGTEKVTTKNFREMIEEQEEKAYNLRKWLTLSGAYLSRTQLSINPALADIPHTIDVEYIPTEDFDLDGFADAVRQRVAEYGNRGNAAVSQLSAQRMELAKAKVPYTLNECRKLINEGHKVLVFSCFRSSTEMLYNGLWNIVREYNQRQQIENGEMPIDGQEAPNINHYKVCSIKESNKGASANIQQAVDNFKKEDSLYLAMVISSLKGGTGVSLENSTMEVIMNDFDWTPRVCEQTEGRAYRINNIMPVRTRYIVAKGSQDAEGRENPNPDEILYHYVRNKIHISKIIQDIDEKTENAFAEGRTEDDEKIQNLLKEQKEAREAMINAHVEYQERMANFMDQHGGGGNLFDIAQLLDADDDFDKEIDFKDREDENEAEVKAFSWHKRIVIASDKSLS